jgi:hypothetical protein
MDLSTAPANAAASPAPLPARAFRARRRLARNARPAGETHPPGCQARRSGSRLARSKFLADLPTRRRF